MARDTPDETVPLELINTKRESVSRFVDTTANGVPNDHAVVQKPLKLKNFISRGEVFDSLHQNYKVRPVFR